MPLTAPYSNAMRLGQGFNTYTQEIRIENAVTFTKSFKPNASSASPLIESGVFVARPVEHAVKATSSEPKPANGAVKPLDGPKAPLDGPAASLDGQKVAIDGQKALFEDSKSSSDAAGKPADELKVTFDNSKLVSDTNDALTNRNAGDVILAFDVPKTAPNASQIVTFSTRAIDNVSDIMDALNISTAMSIKYGTIRGNASAAYVNENKVLDSQLNYIVTVKVNNNTPIDPEGMDFQPIENLPPEDFTEIYGDSFISGFLEGGEFNAVISIDVHDKSKLHSVKQAVDICLAVGPIPVTVGAQEAIDKEHRETMQDTEITISVNWLGGGEIKRPDVPWTLTSVVQVANAFPSMVARCSSVTSAVLTRYTSLRSFQTWRYKMAAADKTWLNRDLILNYTPCQLYTNDLFDAYMAYKKLWKRIDFIMQDVTKWRAREAPKKTASDTAGNASMQNISIKTAITQQHQTESPVQKSAHPEEDPALSSHRTNTFVVDDPNIVADWELEKANHNRDPIQLDPVQLNEARLICREAMTLISEEAARLVDHPDLAYAQFDPVTRKTKMKRPNYPYPDVLKARLPVFVRNDAEDNSGSRDAAAIAVQTFSHSNDLFSHIVGDLPNPHRFYKPFVSLSLNEANGARDRGLCGLSLHAYHHHALAPGNFSKDSNNAIGAIGFHFFGDSKLEADGCSQHIGRPHFDDSSKFHKCDLTSRSISTSNGASGPVEPPLKTTVDITKIDIAYVPGTGRIAGLTFFDNFGEFASEQLTWKQWTATGKEPDNLKVVRQTPPADGGQWKFVGLCGEIDECIWGTVLARVGGVWRRV